MPGPADAPDHHPDDRTPRPRRRRAPLAAPAAAGTVAATASFLATSLDVWTLPVGVEIGVTALAGLLVGLLTWATAGPRERETAGDEGPSWRPPDQWPPVPAHFTGRRESLTELRGVFAARRRSRDPGEDAAPLVVSVYGRAGVGKSTLIARFGHEVAGRFPDGRLHADLRGTVEAPVGPEEVLIGFLRALGVRLTTDPGGLTELRRLWLTWTKGRRILIGLDNAHDGEQVRDLIPAEPGCAVLVTSRQPLFLLNAHDKRLSEFSEAQGVELLARLAGDDRVAADLESAQEIVHMCDRLPLAIGICGGRLATRENWTLRELAGRLRDERRRLGQLELPGRPLDRSVRASLQLSYDDCTGLQRRLLRTLSLLTAPDVPGWVAGELLATSEPDGADQLEALVDAQLAECSGVDFSGVMRYRLHDLVRIFAREIAVSGDDEAYRRAAVERVLSGYLRRAEAAAVARWPQDWGRGGRNTGAAAAKEAQASAADWLNAERLTLVALIHQARGLELWELAWRLGRAFCSLCHSLRAYWSDWRAVAEIVCEAADHMGDRRASGIALLDRAAVTSGQGGHRAAGADAGRALEIFRELGEPWWAARAMRTVGMTLFNEGDLDRGQSHLIEAVAAFKAEDDRWWSARTQRNLAELRLVQRRPEEAGALLEEALAVFKHDGNRYSEVQTLRVYGEVLGATARALHARGEVRAAEKDFARAGFSLERAAEIFRLRDELWEEARCLRAAGEVGNPADGLRELTFVRRATDMLAALGDSWGVARSELSAGRALGRLGRTGEAQEAFRRAIHDFEELDDRWWLARSLRYLGEAHLEAGDRPEATARLRRALDVYRGLGNRSGTARTLELLRRAEEPEGEGEKAEEG